MENILNSPFLAKYLSQEKIDIYEKDLHQWLSKYDARKHFGPIDHFAIKVENEKIFNEALKAIKPYCLTRLGMTPGLSVRKMHGRKIAVALLKEPFYIGALPVTCIEIMQPRPESEGSDVVGLDHLELINSKHSSILDSLKKFGAQYYVDDTNPYKDIIVAFVNDRKERIKFTNKTLAEIVPLQIKDEPERVEILV